ncbi:MAG TPA: 16S rRNA (cytidine(1402)-2'-O)-methyltransferase [Gemmatimonadales bacterium]|nr:16S rRNA (cytidine(1402)-2'-O)-methyltransferase [Gemmatimonadales bacterium]
MSPGTLHVVATPLGNLQDLTLRAAAVLRSSPVVAAEDTRHTRRLLAHLDAHPRLVSVHAHADPARLREVVDLLLGGADVALVSDAGTPAVSDPGAELVRLAREAGIRVVPVPGPSAAAVALSAAGFPADRYLFLGFLPRKGPERRALLARAAAEPWTVVLYEAPTRLVALLSELVAGGQGGRRAVVARELTKLHEELRAGSIAELVEHYGATPPLGEVTLVLEGAPARAERPPVEDLAAEARGLLARGMSRKDVVRRLTESTGLPRNEVYRLVTDLET